MATMAGQTKIDFDAHITTAKAKLTAGQFYDTSAELETALALVSVAGYADNLADWGRLRSLKNRMQGMIQ